jgi:hypothetical protein
MSFRNIRDEGIQQVATAADRNLLLPSDGTIVEQLDNHTLYIYDATTNTWNAVGGGSGGFAFGVIQTPSGTAPVADAYSDVLTLSSSDGTLNIVGDAISDTVDITLAASGAAAGTYPILKATIDSAGRVTAASDNTILTIINAIVFG